MATSVRDGWDYRHDCTIFTMHVMSNSHGKLYESDAPDTFLFDFYVSNNPFVVVKNGTGLLQDRPYVFKQQE
jgi:hypothetical protein